MGKTVSTYPSQYTASSTLRVRRDFTSAESAWENVGRALDTKGLKRNIPSALRCLQGAAGDSKSEQSHVFLSRETLCQPGPLNALRRMVLRGSFISLVVLLLS